MKITKTVRLAASSGLIIAMLATTALPAAAGDEGGKPVPPPASASAIAEDRMGSVDAAHLSPYVVQTRPMPGSNGHSYTYETSTSYWSAMAVKPLGRTANLDVALYDDKEHDHLLTSSGYAGNLTEFVAVDSNHRPFGSYWPLVEKGWTTGPGTYRVELAHGDDLLVDGSSSVAVSSTDVVLVRDTYLLAGEEYAFGIGGVAGAQLFLMGSDPNSAQSWSTSRAFAIDRTPIGGWQMFSYTPDRNDWFGVVVTLPGGSGTVTMVRAGGPAPHGPTT